MSGNDLSDFDDGYHGFDAADLPDPPDPEPPEAREDFPPPFSLDGVDLMRPPGFVGDVADWIDAQCRFPRRRLAVASAIVTVGNIGGLRHEDARDGVTANMLAFCVASSATGKEAVQQAMADLHRAAGLHYAVQGGIKSEQEILRNLIEHQLSCYIIDEIGIFLGKVKNAQKRGGAAYLEGVFGAIMSAYSKANSRMLLGGDIKRELRKIYAAAAGAAAADGDDRRRDAAERMLRMVDDGLDRPFLSAIGYTTPETFDAIIDGETATQGFVGRAIIVTEPDANPAGREGFRRPTMPDWLSMRLMQLAWGGVYDAEPGARIEHVGARDLVATDEAADQMLRQVAQWLHGYADDMGEATGSASVAMVRRAYEMVAKVSFILAMPSGCRTSAHVRWAFAYVRAELDRKIKLVFANDNGRDRPDEAMAARLLNYIDPDKGASLAILANRMKTKPAAVQPILEKLARAGMVHEVETGRKYRGKPVMVWAIRGPS